MKKFVVSVALLALLASAIVLVSCGKEDNEETPLPLNPNQFTDSRDGKVYKTVKIGNQTWMAENWAYNQSGSRCYSDKEDSCKKYGKLYTYQQAKDAAPAGWHLPTDEEWKTLEKYYGMIQAEVDIESQGSQDRGTRADSIKPGSKFNALYAGLYSSSYTNIGKVASFWTATSYFSRALSKPKVDNSISRYSESDGNTYYSVRYVKD